MRAMNLDVWARRFKPLEPRVNDSGDFMFPESEARKHPPTHVWTRLDCDGKLYLSPGFHHVNRTGEYAICTVAHDFPARDVLYYGG